MVDRRPLTLRTDAQPARLQEMPPGDLLPTDTLQNALALLLQGLVTGNNAGIEASDTVLQALGKLQAQVTNRVVTVPGMGLSSNSFTNDERVKLANIAPAATKNQSDSALRDRGTHTGTQPLSSIAGVGTAAALDATIGQTDTTIGRAVRVGDYGIGAASRVPTPNNQKVSGLYYLSGGEPGWPGENGGTLRVEAFGSYVNQMAAIYNLGLFHRGINPEGVAQEWQRLLTSSMINGGVSNTASSSIFETLTNANGTYFKFASGLMICYASGFNGYSAGVNVNRQWPAAFPYFHAAMVCVTPVNFFDRTAQVYGSSSSVVFSSNETSVGNGVSIVGFGRW